MKALEPRDLSFAAALCDVAIPAGTRLPAASDTTLRELERVIAMLGAPLDDLYPTLLRSLDALVRAQTGRSFVQLDGAARARVVQTLADNALGSVALNTVLTPLRITRARELLRLDQAGKQNLENRLPMHVENPRYLERTLDAARFDQDEQLEADAVIVGTGAGGAPLAHALARAGYAVLMLEEGGFHSRADFQGDVLARQGLLYRPLTVAVGNTLIPIPTGISVGGSTTINSGTCFRPPEEVLRRFRFERGLVDFHERALRPYFERVETMLGVCATTAANTSASERLVAKGAETLGLLHGPLLRNAPDCDGQSACCFGCPTDAKRSTNVSYVPAALKQGATLCYHAKVERILYARGRAEGVSATAVRDDGKTVRVIVRAPAVVLACGTFETPALLLRNGLANGSGELGKNLTIHPASHAWARFDHALEGPSGVPQGHFVELPFVDGVRLEGGLPPTELAVTSLMQWGAPFTELLEHYNELAFSGFMIRDDHSRGRVTVDASGRPRVKYWLSARDQHKLVLGHAALSRIFLAAGARQVFPGIFPREFSTLASEQDVVRLERMGPKLSARDFALTAYHPLGTCRMGADKARSVVGANHQTHDVRGLFVCDGSAVPGPLGVNPQITIMALSERASEFVAAHVDAARGVAARGPLLRQSDNDNQAPRPQHLSTPRDQRLPRPSRALRFAETMRGMCHEVTGARRARLVRIDVSAATDREVMFKSLLHDGSAFVLEGFVHAETLSSKAPCHGTLRLSPREPARALVYELYFNDDSGQTCVLYGEKRMRGRALIASVTTLYTEITRGTDHVPYLRGILHFELKHFWPWLASFRMV